MLWRAFSHYQARAIAVVLLTSAAPELCAQQRVGVNCAVNPDATGTPPGGTARRLVIGQSVVFNERISTGRDGQTQLLFLDESAMSIGPNSDLTIDQFVYDPNAGTGKLAISVTRGRHALCRRQAQQAGGRSHTALPHHDDRDPWRRLPFR